MNKVYARINWENYPSENTPINETNLNKIDYGLNEVDNRVIELDTTKVNSSALSDNIKSWSMDEVTGIITIEKYSGEQVLFDLNIEKIPVSFTLSDDGILTMTTDDGTQFTADIGSMIPVLTFEDSDTIAVSVTGTGVNKTYSFSIKNGSVTGEMLEENYLSNINVKVAEAEGYANTSGANATASGNSSTLSQSWAVGGTGTREGEDTNNAKYYAEQAAAVSQVDIATTEKAGIVKPDGNTITVDEDGTIHGNPGTIDYTELENKPSINGVELSGDKSSDDLGISVITEASGISFDDTTAQIGSDTVQGAIEELKKSVSDGKTLVANAITEKGVATEPTDSFSTMADNIGQIESGKKSLILATNPDISIKSSDATLTLSWTQPETEVEIDHYNIYTSLSEPSKLSDMELQGSTSELEYELIGLANDITYYVGIQSVSVEGYENASMWKVENGKPCAIIFLCVGNNASLAYSTDGESWTDSISPNTTATFYGATYGNDRFVAVGSGGDSYYSINGETWVAMSGLGTTHIVYEVIYVNGVFVCDGRGGFLYQSTDGETWVTDSTLGTTRYVLDFAYGNGVFLAVGYYKANAPSSISSSRIFHINDSLNYSEEETVDSSIIQFTGITYGNDRFVIVGTGKPYYSTSGESGTWVAVSGLSSGTLYGVTYGNDRFVAVGSGGDSYYSINGETWVAMSGLETAIYRKVTYGNGRFVCVGDTGLSYYCIDGETWIAMSGLNADYRYNGVTNNRWNVA